MMLGDEKIPLRIWAKLQLSGDCWLWLGAFAGQPQTRWKVDGVPKIVSVRRLLYEIDRLLYRFERAPAGKAIGATCHRRCCNPDHAITGSQREVSLAWEATRDRTTCARGHVIAEVGFYRTFNGKHASRSCRDCVAIRLKERNDRRNARRLKRMSPERRQRFMQRSSRQQAMWREGQLRRRDGSLAITARLPISGTPVGQTPDRP